MKIFIFFVLIFSFAFSACEKSVAENSNQVAKTTPNSTVNPTKTSNNGNYNGKGKVTKINLELVSVELDHEEIKDVMPRMIMEFFVTEKSELEKLKIGDQVDFVLEYKDGQEKIIRIEKAR